jgi:hypothetical protein
LTIVFGAIVEKIDVKDTKQSLTFLRFLESISQIKDACLQSTVGHYTAVIQILRFRLESMLQAVYLDQQHPTLDINQKLCILEEIADKREYFATRLVNMISVNNKQGLRDLYRGLSTWSHPSHLDFPTIDKMIENIKNHETSINCDKLNLVVNLMKGTYDAIFFIIVEMFKETRKSIKANSDVMDLIRNQKLRLLLSTL